MSEPIVWEDFKLKIADYAGMEADEINMETTIYGDLGMDSLGLFSLGMFLIKAYGKKIPLSAVATIQTVGDIFTKLNEEG